MKPWLKIAQDSDFSIYNLPFGIFSVGRKNPAVGIAISDQILDLAGVAKLDLFKSLDVDKKVFSKPILNDFIALGKEKTNAVRLQVQKWLCDKKGPLQAHPKLFVKQADATMHLPVHVGDYTDFYSSIEHATNVGMMFRDPENALLPNWRHIPVGYHGRASSIVVSGTPIHRPKGQTIPKDSKQPIYGASKRLDFELEMAFIIGKNTQLGQSVSTESATDHIFGMVLFNDWSARDIQKWEYVPLGPFLGKNFASSVSPWVVTLEALNDFRVRGPVQKPKPLPYLQSKGMNNYNIKLEVGITPENSTETIVSKSNFRYMYWNMHQQLAHHTVNGCNINIGDMLASGTISGKNKKSYGSMLELSWAGKNPLPLKDGSTRVFINDGDTVTMRGYAEKDGKRVGFGEVRTEVLGAY